jgi:hypothetical protein
MIPGLPLYLVLEKECPRLIPGLALYLFLKRLSWSDRCVSTVPGSGKECPRLIPGLAMYLVLERIVLE